MLVLSRKVGERIQIGEEVRITIVRVAQGVVRVGIEAPRDWPIVREELLDPLAAPHGLSRAACGALTEDLPPAA